VSTLQADRSSHDVGVQLRRWRTQRRLSQLDLSSQSGVSTRHLSFIESGRARPSREMVLRLADELDVPLRERNALLLAAGFAPAYGENTLDVPAMRPARAAIERLLIATEPWPSVVVDREWNLVDANRAASAFLELVDPVLLEPPINVLRLTLHPGGLGGRMMNFGDVSGYVLSWLRRQISRTGDEQLASLYEELLTYAGAQPHAPDDDTLGVLLPLQVRDEARVLSFVTTIATFGHPLDVTLSELAIETFFPADETTAELLRARHAAAVFHNANPSTDDADGTREEG
jgi:transcriptional regulator with XRE-family HTH domain